MTSGAHGGAPAAPAAAAVAAGRGAASGSTTRTGWTTPTSTSTSTSASSPCPRGREGEARRAGGADRLAPARPRPPALGALPDPRARVRPTRRCSPKIHHSVIDGISGAEIMGALFDLAPEGRELPEPATDTAPDRSPSELEMLSRGLLGLPRYPLRTLRSLPRALPNLDEAPVSPRCPGTGLVAKARRPVSTLVLRDGDRGRSRTSYRPPRPVQRAHLPASALRLRAARRWTRSRRSRRRTHDGQRRRRLDLRRRRAQLAARARGPAG